MWNYRLSLLPALFFNITSIHVFLFLLSGGDSHFKANVWYLKILFSSAKSYFLGRKINSIPKNPVCSKIDIYILPSNNEILTPYFLFVDVERKGNQGKQNDGKSILAVNSASTEINKHQFYLRENKLLSNCR